MIFKFKKFISSISNTWKLIIIIWLAAAFVAIAINIVYYMRTYKGYAEINIIIPISSNDIAFNKNIELFANSTCSNVWSKIEYDSVESSIKITCDSNLTVYADKKSIIFYKEK